MKTLVHLHLLVTMAFARPGRRTYIRCEHERTQQMSKDDALEDDMCDLKSTRLNDLELEDADYAKTEFRADLEVPNKAKRVAAFLLDVRTKIQEIRADLEVPDKAKRFAALLLDARARIQDSSKVQGKTKHLDVLYVAGSLFLPISLMCKGVDKKKRPLDPNAEALQVERVAIWAEDAKINIPTKIKTNYTAKRGVSLLLDAKINMQLHCIAFWNSTFLDKTKRIALLLLAGSLLHLIRLACKCADERQQKMILHLSKQVKELMAEPESYYFEERKEELMDIPNIKRQLMRIAQEMQLFMVDSYSHKRAQRVTEQMTLMKANPDFQEWAKQVDGQMKGKTLAMPISERLLSGTFATLSASL